MSDYFEATARLERCDEEAYSLYQLVIRQALAEYHEAIALIPDPKHTPRFDRAKAAAERKFKLVSEPAWDLRNLALRDLMLTGEVSPEVDAEMTKLRDSQSRVMQAAE